MEKELFSIRESHRQSNGAYFGDFPDWLVVCTQHRDSETLTRANFQAFRALLEELSPENEEWTIEGSSHWAVGWVDHLLVAPNTPCHEKALEVLEVYADYPVIDEELYSEMEWDEVVDNCATAFRDWYYDQRDYDPAVIELSENVAPYIASYACDMGDEIREEYWPDKERIFWGYVAYRLAKKHASQ